MHHAFKGKNFDVTYLCSWGMYFKVIKIYEGVEKQLDDEYSCTLKKNMQNLRTQRSIAEIEKP